MAKGTTLLDQFAPLYSRLNKASRVDEFGKALYNMQRAKQKLWLDKGERAFYAGEDPVPYLGQAYIELPNELIRTRARYLQKYPNTRPETMRFVDRMIKDTPRIGNLEEHYLPDYVYETGLRPEDIANDYQDYIMRESRKRWPEVWRSVEESIAEGK